MNSRELNLKKVEKQNYETCKKALNRNGLMLEFIKWDEYNFTKEQMYNLYLIALENNENALKYVNWDELEGGFSKAQIEELCLIAVMEDGLTLEYVTEQTPKICIEALKQNKYAIKYVKDKEKYEKMFDLKYLESQGDASEVFAIKENGEWLFTISYKEDLTKKEFVDYIYNTGGGFDLRLGVNIYKQIYFDFLGQFE